LNMLLQKSVPIYTPVTIYQLTHSCTKYVNLCHRRCSNLKSSIQLPDQCVIITTSTITTVITTIRPLTPNNSIDNSVIPVTCLFRDLAHTFQKNNWSICNTRLCHKFHHISFTAKEPGRQILQLRHGTTIRPNFKSVLAGRGGKTIVDDRGE